jgi:ribose transport system substrate-binding protein
MAACGDCNSGASNENGDSTRRIAVIPKGTTHEFWKSIHAGANKAGEQHGAEVLWKGPVREDDRGEQVKVVEDFISRGVDGIVLAPLDDRALVPPCRDAKRQGIPVTIVDSGIDWDGYVSFVATDNRKGGAMAAERMGELLGGEGRIIVMRYQEGSASTMKRESGFLDALKKKHPKVEVVSSNQYGGATTESAYATAESLLVNYEDIDGIFTPNESTTFGMLRALQDAGRAGDVHFVGFDSSDKLVEGLRKGEIDGLVLQNPFRMGELGIETMVRHLEGKKVDKRIDTGVTMVTRDNMNQPEVKKLLDPALDKWLE